MEDVTGNVRQLYSQHRFGRFNYGDERDRFEPLLFEVLAKTDRDIALFDIGCGRGYWLDAYLRYGIRKDRITCVDLVPTNIADLKQQGFDAREGNVMHLPLDSHVSDLTVSIGLLVCIDDPFKGFQELVRITKPGGRIYLNVYNKLHPYYYIVHKATFPIRYIYWNWTKRVADVVYALAKPVFQPLAYLVFGKFLDEATGKTMFMDQVINPRAHLFTKAMLRSYARRCGCTVEAFRYNRYHLMLSAAIRVDADGATGNEPPR